MDAFRHIAGIEIPEALPISGFRSYYPCTGTSWNIPSPTSRWLLDHEAKSDTPIVHTNAVGLHVPGRFDKVVDLHTCHLQGEPTNQIRNYLRELALEKGLSFYDHRTNEGLLRNLIIRNSTLGEVMVILSVQYDEPEVFELLEAVNEKFPDLTSLMYTINPKKNETLYDQEIITLCREGSYLREAGGSHLQDRAQIFFPDQFVPGPQSVSENQRVCRSEGR